jgi:hypothetical protein
MSETKDEMWGPTDKHTPHMRRDFTNFLQASRDALVDFFEAACQNVYTSV